VVADAVFAATTVYFCRISPVFYGVVSSAFVLAVGRLGGKGGLAKGRGKGVSGAAVAADQQGRVVADTVFALGQQAFFPHVYLLSRVLVGMGRCH
jgi:hypothetical protein